MLKGVNVGDKKAKREARKEEKLEKSRAFQRQHESLKRPRLLINPADRQDKPPRWQFNRLDWEHPVWGWRNINSEKWEDIIRKLSDFEGMTWGQIEGSDTGSHLVEVVDCPNQAVQKRLEELKLDDLDTLFSLRLAGAERIFGILEGAILKLLWYDPNHTVWPTKK